MSIRSRKRNRLSERNKFVERLTIRKNILSPIILVPSESNQPVSLEMRFLNLKFGNTLRRLQGRKLEARIKLQSSLHFLTKTYRLIVIVSTERFQTTDIRGPHQR